jgi:hypothetical protein
MPEMTPAQIEDLYRQIEGINSNISRIHYILNNDDQTSRDGLVRKVHLINTRLEQIELDKKLIYAKASVYGGIGALLVGVMGWLISFVVAQFFK